MQSLSMLTRQVNRPTNFNDVCTRLNRVPSCSSVLCFQLIPTLAGRLCQSEDMLIQGKKNQKRSRKSIHFGIVVTSESRLEIQNTQPASTHHKIYLTYVADQTLMMPILSIDPGTRVP